LLSLIVIEYLFMKIFSKQTLNLTWLLSLCLKRTLLNHVDYLSLIFFRGPDPLFILSLLKTKVSC